MTNQPNPPAAFAATVAPDAGHPVGEGQNFAKAPEAHLPKPAEVVTVVDLPPGVFAPLVVVGSMESALALAASGVLPGPARILAALTPESLAALHLPEPLVEDGTVVQQADGLAADEEPVPALQSPRRVVFAFDGTPESLQAARQAARRAKDAGWTVDGLPAPEGANWTEVRLGHAPRPEADLARIADLWIPWPDADRCEASGEDPCEGLDETRREAATRLPPDREVRFAQAPG